MGENLHARSTVKFVDSMDLVWSSGRKNSFFPFKSFLSPSFFLKSSFLRENFEIWKKALELNLNTYTIFQVDPILFAPNWQIMQFNLLS